MWLGKDTTPAETRLTVQNESAERAGLVVPGMSAVKACLQLACWSRLGDGFERNPADSTTRTHVICFEMYDV